MKITKAEYPSEIAGQNQLDIGNPDTSMVRNAIAKEGAAEQNMWQSLGTLGKGLSSVFQGLAAIDNAKREVRQKTELGNLTVNAETEYLNQKKEFDRSNPNPDTYTVESGKIYDKVVQNTLKQTQDPHVQNMFKIHMNQHKLEILDSANREENRRWIDRDITSKMGQIDSYTKLAGDTTDPALYNTYKENARNVAKSMAVHGEEKARVLESNTMKEIDTAQVRNQILKNPVVAWNNLENGAYPDLDTSDRPLFKKNAETAIKGMQADIEKAQVNHIYQKLQESHGTDYAAIYERLRNQSYMKRNFGDIDATTKASVERLFAEEKSRFDEAKQITSDAVAKDTSLHMVQMTTGEIDRRVREDGLSWQLGEHFKNELSNPPDQPKNPAAYNRLLREITDGILPADKQAEDVLQASMPRADKQELLRYVYRDEDKLGDEAMKKADSYLRKYIITRGLLEKVLPPEEEALYRAQKGLRQRIAEEQKTLKRKLTPTEIGAAAEEIAPLYRKGLAEMVSKWERTTKAEGAKLKTYMKYKTVEDVRKDYKNGKLTWGEATQILKSRFGVNE